MDDIIRSTQTLIEKVNQKYSPEDRVFFEKAFEFAEKAHEGQTRLSGDPFLMHPCEVAGILVDLGLDITTVVAGLFHDIVEDTNVTNGQIKELFGHEIAQIVDGVPRSASSASVKEETGRELRKMFLPWQAIYALFL